MEPLLDQHYFSNGRISQNVNVKKKSSNTSKPYSKKDFKIYRKHVYALTKDLLNKKNTDSNITYYFDNFIHQAIEYLKFKEKEEQIQSELKNVDLTKTPKIMSDISQSAEIEKMNESNTILYKDMTSKALSMDDFVNKRNVKHSKQNNISLPKQRIIKHKESVEKQHENKKNNNNKKGKTMKIDL